MDEMDEDKLRELQAALSELTDTIRDSHVLTIAELLEGTALTPRQRAIVWAILQRLDAEATKKEGS